MDAVRTVIRRLAPLIWTLLVSTDEHGAATSALLAAYRWGLSLVDCVSSR